MTKTGIKTYITKEKGVYSVRTTENEFVFDNESPALIIDGLITISGSINVVGQDAGITVNGAPVSGSGGDIIISGSVGPHIETVTIVYDDYTIGPADYIVGVSGLAPATITLPSNPQLGRAYVVKNLTGGASFQPIAVYSPVHPIDGNNTFIMAIHYQSLTMAFFGDRWGIY